MRAARRIVVCVNACAGIDEPEEVVGGMKYEINALKQKLLVSSKEIVDRDEKIEKMEERLEELDVVDELFIALDEVCDLFAFGDLSTERIRAVYDKARHVVAKVMGVQL